MKNEEERGRRIIRGLRILCKKKSHKGTLDMKSTLIGIIFTKKVEGCPHKASFSIERSWTNIFPKGTKLRHRKWRQRKKNLGCRKNMKRRKKKKEEEEDTRRLQKQEEEDKEEKDG